MANMTPEGIRSNLVNMIGTSLNPLFEPTAAGASPTSPTNTTRKLKKRDKLAEQLLQMLADNQQHQQSSQLQLTTLVKHLGKVEINAPKLKKITREAWIKFVELYDIYRQADGGENMVKHIFPTSMAFAAYTCKLDQNVLLMTSDAEFRDIMNKHFKIDTATGAKTKLQSLAMKKCEPSGYLRDNVETYLNDFIGEIKRNPALVNNARKGATDKQANTWFIDGIQPDKLQVIVRSHDTKDVDSTFAMVMDDLDEFETYLRIAGITYGKSESKADAKPAYTPAKGAPTATYTSTFNKWGCNNCGDKGHKNDQCPLSSECIPCKTKQHGYWTPQCPLFQAWKAKKQATDPTFGQHKSKAFSVTSCLPCAPTIIPSAPPSPPVATATSQDFANVMAAVAMLSAQVASLSENKVRKKQYIDSGANISIVSHMSHLDSNTTPSFRRVDKPFGVETASNGIMKIDGEGKFKNLDSAFCGDAAASLLSVSQFTKSNNVAIVFTGTDAFGVRCDDYVNSQFFEH